MAEKRLYSSLKSFGKGINSDVDCLLLPPDQLSFARNATVRGDFVSQRPSFSYLQFTNIFAPSGSQAASDYADFQAGLFQGATYYRTNVNGYIMVAVNGKLFQISIAPGNQSATVTEIQVQSQVIPTGSTYSSGNLFSIIVQPNTAYNLVKGANDVSWSWDGVNWNTAWPSSVPVTGNITASHQFNILYIQSASPYVAVTALLYNLSQNSTTAVQNWLWQADRFLIWNDGVTLPLFFDGNTTFRSLGPNPSALDSLAEGFTVPAIGQFVTVSSNTVPQNVALNSSWPEGLGLVLIGSALYDVTSYSGGLVGGTVNLGLTQILANGASVTDYSISPGTLISQSNQNCGFIMNAQLVDNTSGTLNSLSTTSFPPIPVNGTTGEQIQITVLGNSGSGSIATGATVYSTASYYTIISTSASTFPNAPVSAGNGTSYSVALNGFSGIQSTFTPSGCSSQCVYSGTTPTLRNGQNVTINGLSCSLSISQSNGTITGITATPVGTSSTAVYAAATIAVPSVSVAVINTFYPCGQLGYTAPAGSFTNTNNNLLYQPGTPPVPNQFTITLNKPFLGNTGDILLVGQGVNQPVVVASCTPGSATITCQMPSGYVASGATILIGGFISDSTTFSGAVARGTTIANPIAIQAIGSTGVTVTFAASGNDLGLGEIVTILGATSTMTGIVTTAPSGNNTYGAQPNYFVLTLSEPFLSSNGNKVLDSMHVGSGSTLAEFQVVTPTISGLSPYQIQCNMTADYGGVVPSGALYYTPDGIVVDDTATLALTGVGTYPVNNGASPPIDNPTLNISSSTLSIVTQPSQDTPSTNEIVQIPTSIGTLYYRITSAPNDSSGTSPSFTIQNINDTEGSVVTAGTVIYSVPQLPVSRMGCYGMGRNWVSLPDGVSYVAGDMIGSSSGSPQYNYADAVLCVSQNYLLASGGTFKISGAGETITAMSFVAQLDASLGQGPLQIFTDETVFSNVAPVDMTTWSALTSPIQIEGLIGSGAISQDAVVQQNNDLIFRLSNGGIQSMLMASQNFNQWGNTPISKEVSRSIKNDDPNLLQYTSMVTFNNRMLMTCQFVPLSKSPRGVYGAAMVALNFDPISSLSGKAPSVWDGEWTGLNVLQLISGTFNGSKQCYALCLSPDLTQIELHQIQLDGAATLDNETPDGNGQPVAWEIESPMLFVEPENASSPRLYKRLLNGDFSVRDITGDITYAVSYRSDQNPNWTLWYGSTIKYAGAADPGYRRRIPIGSPNPNVFDATNNQPMREGYNFQLKIEFVGSCVLTNCRVAADIVSEPEFGRVT